MSNESHTEPKYNIVFTKLRNRRTEKAIIIDAKRKLIWCKRTPII